MKEGRSDDRSEEKAKQKKEVHIEGRWLVLDQEGFPALKAEKHHGEET